MSDRTLRRPWLAALLALFVTGLGHAYLRRWARAFGWYMAVAAAVFLFVPESAIDVVLAGDPPPVRDVAPAAAVVAASVIDAYVVAHRINREHEREHAATETRTDASTADGTTDDADAPAAETVRCPECGRESDTTVDFCQWCAEPLDERDAP